MNVASRAWRVGLAGAAGALAGAAAAAALDGGAAGLLLAAPLGAGLTWLALAPDRARLNALTDAVAGLAEGDHALRHEAGGADEIGRLAAQVERLATAMRAESAAVRERELLLDTLLQSAPMAVLIVDGRERVVYANRLAASWLARGGSLDGRALAEVAATAPPGWQAALSGPPDAVCGIAGEEGPEVVQTARRRFQIRGREHTFFLARMVTRELRRQEVEAWRRLLRVIAHELNNSLAPIGSLAQSGRLVIGRPELYHELECIFATIEDRAAHLGRFLEGYARFARLPRPRLESVDWARFLERLGRMEPFLLSTTPPTRPGRFDPAQLEQSLLNLLRNAREAGSPPDAITVEVTEDANGGVLVSVLDRGHGMTDEVRAQALLPFFSTRPAGTGLGLALCREIVEAHGGRLALQARDGGGTRVDVCLPAAP